MPNLNQNAGYGQAIIGAIHSAIGGTFGNVFLVMDPDDTDEGNYQHLQDLFPPDAEGRVRFFTDLSEANDATESNNNDVIILDGNSTHTLTEMLTVSNNRVHFIGLDYLLGIHRKYGQRTKVHLAATATATNIATIEVTGVRCSFRGIKFTNSSTVDEGIYCFVDAGEYTFVEDCEIYKDTDLDVTGAAELLMNGDGSHYKNCYIGSTVNAISGAILRPCVLLSRETITGKVARDFMFEDCIFARKCGNTGNRFVYGANATDVERMGLFKNCIFWNTKLASATPAQNVAFGNAQTEGYVLLHNCTSIGAATAMSTTTGVFIDSAVPAADTSGISLQCT